MLERAGRISSLTRQKKFTLIPAQYEADIIGPRGGKKKGSFWNERSHISQTLCTGTKKSTSSKLRTRRESGLRNTSSKEN